MNRRRSGFPLSLFLTALGLVLFHRPVTAQGQVVVVTDPEGIHLRGGPGTRFASLAVIPVGTELPLLGERTSDGWLPAAYQGQRGFVFDQFVRLRGAAPALTSSSDTHGSLEQVASPEGVNLRAGPGLDERILAVIPPDTRLTTEDHSADNQWARVRYAGQIGWVAHQYLTPLNADTVPPPTRFIWPVASRLITSTFGPGQLGIDIDQFQGGQPVVAAAAGRISFAGGDPCCSYGLYVMIDHGDGTATLYAHLQAIDVQTGQLVTQGQLLGKSGSTGRSTGPHLHFEIRVGGVPVNPLFYLPPS
ncbi:MAG: hypothetical protein DCC57_09525 [Chloroflexi bacterium]|nr:MAG: hypothetical protein DCC57_09525 [Chloroflexota bacterium]